MDIKSFELFEKRLRDSKCPEDFFGPPNPHGLPISEQMDLYKENKDKEYKHLKEITKKPEDANQKHRVSMVLSLFLLFDSWAIKKIADESYGRCIDYRLKLLFEVKKWEDGTLHFFLVRNDSLHNEKLFAGLFEDGYLHSDQIYVLREGIPIRKGFTSEYGTHAATVCFYGIEKEPTPYLEASSFAENDMIEINTWEYGSIDEFIRRFN